MILKLTESDRLIGTLVEADYYPMVVTKFGEPGLSSSKKSTSMFVDMQISDGKFKGKELSVAFNTETNSPKVLVSMVFMPWGFLFNLASAITNQPAEAVPTNLDTDMLVGKPFDAQISKTISDGVPVNAVMGFLPSGTGAGKGAAIPF